MDADSDGQIGRKVAEDFNSFNYSSERKKKDEDHNPEITSWRKKKKLERD